MSKIKNTSDMDLIELSGKWVYHKPERWTRLIVNKSIYKVKKSEFKKSPTGLDYMIVQNIKTGEISMIFEGTQGTQDMITDATLPGFVPDTQLKAAMKAYEKEKKTYAIRNVAGNSLAGALSNYVASKYPVNSVTYNPAILIQGTYNKKNGRITNYMSEYDPLTLGERAPGYESRFPGSSVILKNNLPLSETLGSNHTGYSDDIEISGVKVKIDADDFLPIGVWSGKVLGGGRGQRIDVNPANLERLARALASRMNGQVKTAKSYLDTAADIVNKEGGKLDDRKTKLQEAFSDLLKKTSFGAVLANIGKYEAFKSELKAIIPYANQVSSVATMLSNSSILAKLMDFLSGSSLGHLALAAEIPLIVGDAILKIDVLVEAVGRLEKQAIPKLFKGIDNHFFNDAMVTELKKHYRVLDRNKDLVTEQVLLFSKQVNYVNKELKKADRLLSAHQKVASVAAPPISKRFVLKESNALKDGMGKKQKLLDENFKQFSKATNNVLKPALHSLKSTLDQLDTAIYQLLQAIKTIQNGIASIDVPFTKIDTNIKVALSLCYSEIAQRRLPITGAVDAVGQLERNIGNVLHAYRPYIDTALFEGTKFSEVIILNKASVNALDSAKMIFKDIKYQLSANESAAIKALDKIANDIVCNLAILLSQIKKGSIRN